jgi:hypothetical protein
MQFQDYTSKPIIRRAACIKENESIAYNPEKSEATVGHITFKCYEQPQHGDYVVYLSPTDVYHCSAVVFKERNIV